MYSGTSHHRTFSDKVKWHSDRFNRKKGKLGLKKYKFIVNLKKIIYVNRL